MKSVGSGIVPVISIDRNSPTSLQRQIYDAYRTAIVSGRLRPKQRIPSTRTLTSELGVSRFPVLNAYAQLLAEGYFESRVGSGTVVAGSLPDPSPELAKASRSAKRLSGARPTARDIVVPPQREASPWLRGWGAFAVGQVAYEEFPLRQWSNLVTRRSRNVKGRELHYGERMGVGTLREAIANYLNTARSLRCDAEQIMIVSGSQQALELSARVLCDRGDRMWVEEPGYPFARDAFSLTGCKLVPVPVDDEGLNVAAGIKRCRNARAASVTPSHQFPLGVTMSASRRLQLLEWAQTNGSWIIEDDYDSEYRYESPPIASLQGLDENERVIYIGTFSKVLFPSLRLGYVVIPRDLVDRFAAIRWAVDLCPPTFLQDVLADFIAEGHFARHIRRMRVLYRERRSVLVDCLRREMGSAIEILGCEAGMHLVITSRRGIRDREIAERAARQKLWIWPLSSAYLGEARQSGFILGFGSTPVSEIPRAVRKLRELMKP